MRTPDPAVPDAAVPEAAPVAPGPAAAPTAVSVSERPPRGPRVRRIADRLSVQFRVPIEPQYDQAGHRWTLRWYDGPTVAAVRCALERLFPNDPTAPNDQAAPGDPAAPSAPIASNGPAPEDAARLAVRRDLTTRALVLAAIRETRAGAMHRSVGSWGQRYHLEQLLADQEHPDRTADPREAAMLERLLEASSTDVARGAGGPDLARAFDLVARDGVAWLLPEPHLAGPADRDALALTPLEYLTSRYATGVHRAAWETALTPLPLRAAVSAAHQDPEPGPDAARAALTLLPALRARASAELDAVEARLAAVVAAVTSGSVSTPILPAHERSR
ncbi:hypothetical protein [Kitasatospora sp. CB01950]|uniref:hypothetical protein n=1 Tax=Kitasatospora sp. CB01950 TaxID=1703930 RepID=UPI000938FFCF|nr:hypothetical protein [Kitasatospora sp. CB01950]OKJ13620.1 hypothetical protein AMK19_09205 [Kitasatospora sp. CB01950]